MNLTALYKPITQDNLSKLLPRRFSAITSIVQINDEFIILCNTKVNSHALATSRNPYKIRLFKSLDAAANTLQRMGVTHFVVTMTKHE